MQLPHLASRLYGTPLLVARSKLDIILAVLGDRIGWPDPKSALPIPPPRGLPDPPHGIAVIPIYGTLVRRSLGVEAASGLTSYGDLSAMLDSALADPSVNGIVLDVDSSGGEAGGVFEFAGRVRAADAVKPVWSIASDSAFSAAYALPVVGFVAAIAGILILRALPAQGEYNPFRAVALPEFDPHMRQGNGFRQAGMRSFLANSRAPVASRLRALVALQNISGRVATPLLRNVLTDPSEDIRLLAYGMLDNKEKHLNQAIHAESARYSQAPVDSRERGEAARRLADLYWELVYQELAQGDLRTHALQQSLQFTTLALQSAESDAGLHMRHARLLQSLGEMQAARTAYDRALALGMPKTRILPYLAELAFDTGDFSQTRALMNELDDWQSLPRLQPVIRYWRRA